MTVGRAWLLSLALAGCGAGGIEYPADGLGRAAGAKMEVEMGAREAQGYPITVEIEELPLPWEIVSGARTYAVWIAGNDGVPRLAGTLDYDRDAQHGQLHTHTPYDELTVLVTAEPARIPPAPLGVLVAERAIVHRPAA